MSLGYAERLSFREDLGGRLGAPEIHQSARAVLDAAAALAGLLAEAERVVAFTGAGISTACGVPDFRGPNGVWTLQRAGRPLPRLQTSFAYAQPSFTHMVGRMCGARVWGAHPISCPPSSAPSAPVVLPVSEPLLRYCVALTPLRPFCCPIPLMTDHPNRRCSRCCAPAR